MSNQPNNLPLDSRGRISEIINHLQRILTDHGDLEFIFLRDEGGWIHSDHFDLHFRVENKSDIVEDYDSLQMGDWNADVMDDDRFVLLGID